MPDEKGKIKRLSENECKEIGEVLEKYGLNARWFLHGADENGPGFCLFEFNHKGDIGAYFWNSKVDYLDLNNSTVDLVHVGKTKMKTVNIEDH